MLEVSKLGIYVKILIFLSHFFVYLFVYYFFLDRSQFALMKLYTIRAVFFNRGSAERLGSASGCGGFRRNRPKLPGTKFATTFCSNIDTCIIP